MPRFTIDQEWIGKADTVHNLKDLAADFWPQEDSVEEFLASLPQQRQEVI